MQNKQETPRIERDTCLIVPHKDSELRFEFPPQGPSNYQTAGSAVLQRGLYLPTGSETASLLHEVYCTNDKEFKESLESDFIRKNVIKNGWLWVFNRNTWTPKNVKNAGVYVQHDAQAKGISTPASISDLEDALSGGTAEHGVRFSKDRKTAFASYNTVSSGNHNKGTLAKNGFIIASYDIDGAEKIDNVAKKFTFKPYVWTVDNTGNDNTVSLSALVRGWFDGYWLVVVGDGGGVDGVGFAFGVRAPNAKNF